MHDFFAWMDKEGWKAVGQPRAVYVDGAWNQEDSGKWLTLSVTTILLVQAALAFFILEWFLLQMIL